jgi:5-methylcytosine-specific restriction endonuclease McrA
MIELSEEDLLMHKGDLISIKMSCMICMAFPEIIIRKDNTRIWEQVPNPVPSNRLCLHTKHDLECPHCKVGVVPEEEIRERYFIEPNFREQVLKRDKYTCQACGYKQKEKPISIPRKSKNESDAGYLFRRFASTLGKSGQNKSLIVAHCSRKYENETYENRHKMENARTLCVDCHNIETAKHQMERWLKKMNECPWLKQLE